MSLSKSKRLVEALVGRTEKGTIDWQESFAEAFQVSFKDNSVRIEWKEGRAEGSPLVTMSLINGDGEVVDRFNDEDLDAEDGARPGGPWFRAMKNLYTLALRHARGADKVLNDILNEIEDDIPF